MGRCCRDMAIVHCFFRTYKGVARKYGKGVKNRINCPILESSIRKLSQRYVSSAIAFPVFLNFFILDKKKILFRNLQSSSISSIFSLF